MERRRIFYTSEERNDKITKASYNSSLRSSHYEYSILIPRLASLLGSLRSPQDPANNTPYFPSVGSTIPSKWATVKKLVEDNKKER